MIGNPCADRTINVCVGSACMVHKGTITRSSLIKSTLARTGKVARRPMFGCRDGYQEENGTLGFVLLDVADEWRSDLS